MKCEDFLAAYESENAWQRWRAARHAARCPGCVAAARTADELRRELSEVEPVAPALRTAWATAADEVVAHASAASQPAQWNTPVLAAAALFLVTIGLVIWASTRPDARRVKQIADSTTTGAIRSAPGSSVPSIDVSGELRDLLARVDALQREIESTVKEAELLDARMQADRMIATYSQW